MSSAYMYQLPENIISETLTAQLSNSASFGLEAKATFAAPSKVGVGARWGAMLGRKRDRSDKRSTQFKRRILLVAFEAEQWLVGDAEYGDPRNQLGR
jgi:hypothetical protein